MATARKPPPPRAIDSTGLPRGEKAGAAAAEELASRVYHFSVDTEHALVWLLARYDDVKSALSTLGDRVTELEAAGGSSGITALTGDVTGTGPGSTVATIAANAVTTAKILDANVTPAKISNRGALSVLGRSANSAGVPADISGTASTAQVLRVSGTSLAFATLAASEVTNDSSVTGTTVKDALDTIQVQWGGQWTADVPPTSPEAENDEFTAGSIDAQWTAYDHPTLTAFTADSTRGRMTASYTGNGGHRWVGLTQAVPGSEYVVYTKCQRVMDDVLDATLSSYSLAGIAVFQGTGATDDFFAATHGGLSGGLGGGAVNQPGYASHAGNVSGYFGGQERASQYFRIRVSGASVWGDGSFDGVTWHRLHTLALAYTPTHMGLVFKHSRNATVGYGHWDFFRVFSGAGSSAFALSHLGGRM